MAKTHTYDREQDFIDETSFDEEIVEVDLGNKLEDWI